jgi:hypothetical protein
MSMRVCRCLMAKASHDAYETGQRLAGFCRAALAAVTKMYSGVARNNSRSNEVGTGGANGLKVVELGFDMMVLSKG